MKYFFISALPVRISLRQQDQREELERYAKDKRL